jgi:hypothetical protein
MYHPSAGSMRCKPQNNTWLHLELPAPTASSPRHGLTVLPPLPVVWQLSVQAIVLQPPLRSCSAVGV